MSEDQACPIDDDHFTYDNGGRKCISQFGEDAIARLDCVDADDFEDMKRRILALVRWCREFNGENQRLKARIQALEAERGEMTSTPSTERVE